MGNMKIYTDTALLVDLQTFVSNWCVLEKSCEEKDMLCRLAKYFFMDSSWNGSYVCTFFLFCDHSIKEGKLNNVSDNVRTEFVLSVVILYTLQKHYSESRDIDTISRVHGELDELKNIMVKNIGELVVKCYSNHYFLDKRVQKIMLLVYFNGSIILWTRISNIDLSMK
jgi:hypothetical protein